MTKNLLKIGGMYEIKGVFCIENKGNSKKPIIQLNSRNKKVVAWVYLILKSYDIKLTLVERKTFMTLKIQYKKNCLKFINLMSKYIIIKPLNYELVKLWSIEK